MFCTQILYNWHGQFFGAHLRIFILNNLGNTISFNSVSKMFHIVGPKHNLVSEPYMAVLILLPCSAVVFLRLYFILFWRKISVNISDAMLFFTLNISYATVSWLRWYLVTDLSFSKSSEKHDERWLYNNSSIECSTVVHPN